MKGCDVLCFGHKIQECVWAFCHKNNRGGSRLSSPAESPIDSESNKHATQHCDLESRICWITFPDWTAVILELLLFTSTRVHLKEKPLSPSISSPLQLSACQLIFLESYLYFSFHVFLVLCLWQLPSKCTHNGKHHLSQKCPVLLQQHWLKEHRDSHTLTLLSRGDFERFVVETWQ